MSCRFEREMSEPENNLGSKSVNMKLPRDKTDDRTTTEVKLRIMAAEVQTAKLNYGLQIRQKGCKSKLKQNRHWKSYRNVRRGRVGNSQVFISN